ncbi:MAG: HEAT repeat domain-containing protein, partial [Bacteroidota bacterium]
MILFLSELHSQISFSSVKEWLQLLSHHGNKNSHFEVAFKLKEIGVDSILASNLLIRALQDKDPQIRKIVLYQIGEFKPIPSQTIPALLKLFDDPDEEVRTMASISLAKFGEIVIPYLVKLLKLRGGQRMYVDCY